MTRPPMARRRPDTAWLSRARFGLFVHFLPHGAGFQAAVDALDVEAFAEDCRAAGAGYVIWTVGQNTGYFCTPSATYDRAAGRAAGDTCSTRDLPMDLAAALARRGLRLLLYAPSPPAEDVPAARGLCAAEAVTNFNGTNWLLSDGLVARWAEVMREWSDRYGGRVSGWWLDGCYRESGFTDAYAAVYDQAVKSGNPDALVAFNTGLNYDVVSPSEDFLAGESNVLFDGDCRERLVSGVQWHELSFLGTGWGDGTPRCTGASLT